MKSKYVIMLSASFKEEFFGLFSVVKLNKYYIKQLPSMRHSLSITNHHTFKITNHHWNHSAGFSTKGERIFIWFPSYYTPRDGKQAKY